MPKTAELSNRQIRNIAPFLQQLSTRSLPGVSLVRLGHTMDNLQPFYENVIENRTEITKQYQATDMSGNDVYVDSEGDRYVIDSGEEKRGGERDYSPEDDFDGDEEDKPTSAPPEAQRRAYIAEEQREEYNEEIEGMLSDPVDVEVYPFPMDETEDVMEVVEDIIAENVETGEEEAAAGEEDFDVTLQSIRPILFMFEKS